MVKANSGFANGKTSTLSRLTGTAGCFPNHTTKPGVGQVVVPVVSMAHVTWRPRAWCATVPVSCPPMRGMRGRRNWRLRSPEDTRSGSIRAKNVARAHVMLGMTAISPATLTPHPPGRGWADLGLCAGAWLGAPPLRRASRVQPHAPPPRVNEYPSTSRKGEHRRSADLA